LQRKKLIEHFVLTPKDECGAEIEKLTGTLREYVEKIRIDANRDASSPTRKGRKLQDKWATYHHATYLALCRNKGERRFKDGKETKYESWNADVLDILADTIRHTFAEILKQIDLKQEQLLSQINLMMNSITQHFEGRAYIDTT